MTSRLLMTALVAAAALLAACTEKPQTSGAKKGSPPAYNGTGSKFVAPGWKPGDATSWEENMRARVQSGQNEYSRASAN